MQTELYNEETISPEERDINSKKAFGRLLPLLKDYKGGLILCLILLATATGLSLYWPILMKRAIDVNITNGDFNGLFVTVLIIAGIQCLTIVFQYIQRIKLEIIGQNVMLKLKNRIFHHLLKLDLAFFDKHPVGRLMARVENDTEALRMLFTNTAVLIITDILLIAGIFGVMFYFSPWLALILFSIMPIVAVLTYVFQFKTTPHFLEVRRKMAEVTAAITEFLHGISIIQIFHRGN
jgi:ATP-binding cassette subfamily B multidrug efflux pump